MSSGAVNALSAIWLSYAALAIPILIPFTFRLFQHGYAHDTFLGLLVLTFLGVMLLISYMSQKSISQTLKIRYENTNLLEKLRIQTNQAQTANQDKSRFLAAASHDLRQPVHSLSLLSSAISPEIHTDRGKKILSQIGNANDTMLSLLNSLLDMSKLDAGIVKADIQPFNLQTIINSLVDEFMPIANQNGLQLRSRTCPFMVESDPVLLQNIMRNLLQNAIRYTKSGKVLIACRKRKDTINIQVWDTGKGIAKADQEIIFAEYQQLHNPERDQNKGLGLGLSICRRLAKLLNIQIKLRSVVSKGSVFCLEIPLLPKSISFASQPLAPTTSSNTALLNPLEGAIILVIDDNESVLEAMSSLLKNWGCQIITADSVETSIKVAKTHKSRIDAIIADYRLRNNTTGIEAIDAFSQTAKVEIPSIIITGDTAPERMQEITSHGLPVLHKPVKEAHLKSVMGRLLRMSK
jgi:signal transduction histidine kinase/CheY-like chemotaxis protein